ncbi:hypothetical protein CKM354_000235000 [Cercospora kikuchii]|uniref:mRNA-capping enzyme subunit beta n=1 Tax=Cercospora kikuchii TaxID=84275 RepID=A0A9P3FDW5_9PEZI|nr:uncharacterized protein CKM354_000235000 [Cercospora kikuchii]GIZ38955.1 hypothetical protein CKM354_000235000 [Cercospora kikuchii]
MDLRSLMNDGPAPEKKASQGSPPAPPPLSGGRSGGQHAPPPSAVSNGAPGPGPSAVYPAAGFPPPGRTDAKQQGPIYGQPPGSSGPPSQPHSRGLTPLRTPGSASTPGSTSYPFPQQHQQQQQQQPLQSPATAGPPPQQYRPYEAYPSTTPGGRPASYGNPYGAQPSPSQYAHHPSQSPGASSHHSQTPHSMRQSPRAVMGHPPPQHQPHFQHQHSQPSTPLGPPTHVPRHAMNGMDATSPFHQRTVSGASNGYVARSPAQHQSSIGSLIESPVAHPRQSPRRSASEYTAVIDDRGRSESVSPKTKVPPRPPSLGSRHSSQHEAYSARNSLQPSTASAASFSEVQNHVQPSPANYHQASASGPRPSPPQNMSSHQQPEHQRHTPIKPDPAQQNGILQASPNASNRGIKRSAAESESSQPPVKRERRRKYTERPVWARLHPANPRLRMPGVMPNGPEPRPQPQQSGNRPPANPPPQVVPQANGQKQPPPQQGAPGVNFAAPWLENPPIDHDMLRMRRLMGGAWEKTIQWTTPMPSLTKAVTDWLVSQLLACEDVAQDPKEGQIEIEAKVGRLFNKGNGQRFAMPVQNMVVISPQYAEVNCSFESEMQQHEHKAMNDFLNKEVRNTHTHPGRQKLSYEHLEETDTFERLSKIGLNSLPEAIHRRHLPRDPKMRTTTESSPKSGRMGQVKARIIKVKVADLHIYNPLADYDLRITMNVECNLMRADLDPGALVEAPTPDKPNQPARVKNRLSYKHLNGIYQIDLTKVDQVGLAPKFELELEVDAGALRKQLAPLLQGGESAFVQIVDGFIDNATILMQQKRSGP